MKKLLTLALALVALTVLAGLSVGQDKEKVLTGKVTQVNKENKTFTVEVTFSAKAIPLPKKEDRVDVIYTPNPTGGPPEATTVKGSKSNGSERVVPGQFSAVTGKVLSVNSTNKTFTVEVTFSATDLKDPLPGVGKIYDITFTQPTPGGPLKPTTIKGSKSKAVSF